MYSEWGRYVINIHISREISIEHPSVGLASLAQLLASERSERDTPRSVQLRIADIYIIGERAKRARRYLVMFKETRDIYIYSTRQK